MISFMALYTEVTRLSRKVISAGGEHLRLELAMLETLAVLIDDGEYSASHLREMRILANKLSNFLEASGGQVSPVLKLVQEL